jgi:hypothetical protein
VLDQASGLYLPGNLLEPERQNVVLSNRDLSSGWTTRGAAGTGSTTGVDGQTKTIALSGLGTWGANDIYRSSLLTGKTQDEPVALSFWVRHAGASVGLRVVNSNGVAYGDWTIDLPSIPTNTWTKIDAGSPYVTIAQAHRIIATGQWGVGFAAASGSGLACDVDFSQGEYNQLFATSEIEVAGTPVTRTADSALIYSLGPELEGKELTLLVPVFCPSYAPPYDIVMLQVYDAANPSTEVIGLRAKATTGVLRVTTASASGNAGLVEGATSICDGRVHWVGFTLRPNLLAAWTDGVASTVDTDVAVPTSLNRVGLYASGHHIGSISMWPKFMCRMPRPLTQAVM